MAADPRSRFRDLALSSGSELGMSLLAMLEDTPAIGDSTGSEGASRLPLTYANLKAAVADTFTVAEIAVPDQDLPDLLGNSIGVMLGGERRLRLLPDVRAELIHSARLLGFLQPALDRAPPVEDPGENADAQRQTQWVAALLSGQIPPLDGMLLEDLRAAARARESLAKVELNPQVPTLGEFQRRLELAEILEPLRILIGYKPPAGGEGASDRFAGREAEITALRKFVNELESQSSAEAISRGVSRVRESFAAASGSRYPAIFMLVARGGLGKSSLIAKFLLDHALDPRHPVPFAYFDFDRAALQSRDAGSLLSEVIRQLAAQFPLLSQQVETLRMSLRETATNASALFDEFRRLLRTHVLVDNVRSFLLVLDTMEIVQGDQRALDAVIKFLDLLAGDGFPELRIVVAGRAEVRQLRRRMADSVRAEDHILPALEPNEARQMADALGTDLLGPNEWNPRWAVSIVGDQNQRETRCEPLVIRVAVDLVCSAPPEKREDVANAIGERGEAADRSFIGRLYERRVLDHVRDPYARRLAWPGLVLRKISKEIARDLLALRCGLDPAHVDQAFDALGREVWIVDRNGDVLTHRADLRARTLPLMRDRDLMNPASATSGFFAINAAAIDWFAARQSASLADRTEWIYHRLLGGEDIQRVEADWSDDLAPMLSGAPDDFEVFAPSVARYLQARTSTTLMSLDQLVSVETPLALDHVSRVARYLGEFNDARIEPALLHLSRRDPPSTPLPPRAATAAGVIAVKTGRWFGDDLERVRPEGGWADIWMYAKRFRQTRMSATGPDRPTHDFGYIKAEDYASQNQGWMLWCQDIAAANLLRLPDADQLDNRYTVYTVVVDYPHELACLRTASIFAQGAARQTARAWLDARRQISGYRYARAISGAEFLALIGPNGERIEELTPLLAESLDDIDLKWHSFALQAIKNVPLRIDDQRICEAVERYLGDLVAEDSPEALMTLREFMAARNEDWMMPLGYAVARMIENAAVPKAIISRMREYGGGRQRRSARRNTEIPDEALGLVQRADEAGDLMAVLDILMHAGDSAERAEFQRLVGQFKAWRTAITGFLQAQREGGAKHPAPLAR